MVTTTTVDDTPAYRCDDCGLHYRDEDTAAQCEEYCREYNMCDSEITKQSIERQRDSHKGRQIDRE